MRFRTFIYNKLVRDRTVERCKNAGSRTYWSVLNDQEFIDQLGLKCVEEALEVQEARTKEERIEELADLLEVVNAYCDLYGISLHDIQAVQAQKKLERGGFEKRIFVTKVEHGVGTHLEQYCAEHPEKYPEEK